VLKKIIYKGIETKIIGLRENEERTKKVNGARNKEKNDWLS
jgi:hypothetical protein